MYCPCRKANLNSEKGNNEYLIMKLTVMKMKPYIGIILLLLCVSGGCKNDDFFYQDVARVRMEAEYRMAVGTDSVNYSFATESSAVKEKKVKVLLTLMGTVVPQERKVKLLVDPKLTTAQKETHYVFPETVVLPGEADTVSFYVTLKRTDELENSFVYLTIRLAETEDFLVGVTEWSRLKIKWSDMIEKPVNWDKLQEFFGEYSEVKFRFILEHTGVSEFTYGQENGMNWSQMYNYKTMVQAALVKYNDEHPGKPLVDENNKVVTFPEKGGV